MKAPTKQELAQENRALREQLDVSQKLLIDLVRGRAVHQHLDGCNWLISRPAAPSGGCALTWQTTAEGWSINALDLEIRNARQLATHASEYGARERRAIEACATIAIEAAQLQQAALDEHGAHNEFLALPSTYLGHFRRLSLGDL